MTPKVEGVEPQVEAPVGAATKVLTMTVAPEAPKPRFFYPVNGIRLKRNQFFSWQVQAERWIESSRCPPNWRAQSFTYQSYMIERVWLQDKLVKAATQILCERISDLPDEHVTCVGHSNGCGVIAAMFEEDRSLKVNEVHLLAAAISPDFNKNGLNEALERGQIDIVYCYCSENDGTLKASKFVKWLGYGNLGYTGPIWETIPESLKSRVAVKWWNDCDHSGYFRGSNFDRTMRHVIYHGEDSP
jgi:hypothetical protein